MNAADLERLDLLVSEKGWSIYDGLLRGRNESVKRILTNFLAKMEAEERALAFQLLDRYLILKDYVRPSLDLLERICDKFGGGSIRIAPVKVSGASRIKSGDALVYDMDANQGVIVGANLNFHDDPFLDPFWDNNDAKVVVDDFVGTGDQFLGMIDEFKNRGIDPKISLLATLVIQEDGKKKIENAGIEVLSLEVRPKALESIALEIGQTSKHVEAVYLNIEERVECLPFESMGYKGTQATVTMKKTPDNTLTIFWNEGSNQNWPAPFPRKMK